MTPRAFCKIGTDRRRMSHPEKHITPAANRDRERAGSCGELLAHEMSRIFLVFAKVFDEFRVRQQNKMQQR